MYFTLQNIYANLWCGRYASKYPCFVGIWLTVIFYPEMNECGCYVDCVNIFYKSSYIWIWKIAKKQTIEEKRSETDFRENFQL